VKEVKPLEHGGNAKTITMKGVKHYTEGGEYKGATHKMNGKVHTGAKHSEASEVVSHSPNGPFKMNGFPVHAGISPMAFKGADSSNSSCWKGYKKVGTKKSPSGTGKTVNDCKKI
jgi:hypothetical protein